MRTLIKLPFLLFFVVGMAACYTMTPLETGASQNNDSYEVSYLFEQDGVKVYRFYDRGDYVYFTTRGDVTSIKNDSTAKRTVTFSRDRDSIIVK